MTDIKQKKEVIYNLVMTQDQKLLQMLSYHKHKDAQAYMAATCYIAKQQREEQGITDCELLLLSNDKVIVRWNEGKSTLGFEIVRTVLK